MPRRGRSVALSAIADDIYVPSLQRNDWRTRRLRRVIADPRFFAIPSRLVTHECSICLNYRVSTPGIVRSPPVMAAASTGPKESTSSRTRRRRGALWRWAEEIGSPNPHMGARALGRAPLPEEEQRARRTKPGLASGALAQFHAGLRATHAQLYRGVHVTGGPLWVRWMLTATGCGATRPDSAPEVAAGERLCSAGSLRRRGSGSGDYQALDAKLDFPSESSSSLHPRTSEIHPYED